MLVLLRYHGIVGDLIRPQVDSVDLEDGATVGDVLDQLSRQSERTAAVLRQTQVFVEGRQAERSTVLSDGVTLTIMRPIAGGSRAGESVAAGSGDGPCHAPANAGGPSRP